MCYVVGFVIICVEHSLRYKSLNWVLVLVFEVWAYFEFEPEDGGGERGLIVPEEDFPAGGDAPGDDARRNNAPSGSLVDPPSMAALANIL